METLATEASPIVSTGDRTEADDTSLQLVACSTLVLLAGGAWSWQLESFYELVRLSISINFAAAD